MTQTSDLGYSINLYKMISTYDDEETSRRAGKCLFNALAYNCDFQDAIGMTKLIIKS